MNKKERRWRRGGWTKGDRLGERTERTEKGREGEQEEERERKSE